MEAKNDSPMARYRPLIVSMSLVIAFLAANPFADAAGFPREDPGRGPMPAMLRVAAGFVVFFASCALLGTLIGMVRSVVDRLGSTARPDWRLALASTICGTVCLLAALFVQVYAATHPTGVSISPTMTFNAGPGAPSGAFNMEARGQASLALNLVSLLTFLAGAGLLAFGIWGSLKPAAPHESVAKPEGWGEPMIDAARA